MTTIVTLSIDAESQAHFDRLRKEHYPSQLNRIAAHLTLFHALPDAEDVRAVLANAAAGCGSFSVRVSGLMSLGRGVAYAVESPALMALHAELASAFKFHLIPQDRQRFRPHVVVQNKVSGAEAKALLGKLTGNFAPWEVRAEGLSWWNYLGGPWSPREKFTFTT